MTNRLAGIALSISLAACGGKDAFAPPPDRYNFGVVDGGNQSSVAGASALGQPITSQLTRDPNGKFAYRLQRILLPPFAHAQGLTMPGTPVSGAIVCAREADAGEPKAFPLCAFTNALGKAPITIQGGTKAGTYRVVFSAQVQSQQPVRDSTDVTVEAGPPATWQFRNTPIPSLPTGTTLDLRSLALYAQDQYQNFIRREVWIQMTPGVALRHGGEPGVPSPDFYSWTVTFGAQWSGKRVYVYAWLGNARDWFAVDIQ